AGRERRPDDQLPVDRRGRAAGRRLRGGDCRPGRSEERGGRGEQDEYASWSLHTSPSSRKGRLKLGYVGLFASCRLLNGASATRAAPTRPPRSPRRSRASPRAGSGRRRAFRRDEELLEVPADVAGLAVGVGRVDELAVERVPPLAV